MKFSHQRAIDKETRKASEELTEMLKDTARKMFNDQIAWLDTVMRDILPPVMYEAGLRNESFDEIGDYLAKHKFKIIHVPDSYSMRIMRGDQIHAEFKAQLTVDGEPIEIKPEMNPGLN